MFQNISYKKKTLYVTVFFALLLMGSYKKNFKEIIELNKQLRDINQRENAEDINTRTYYIQKEVKVIEDLIGGVDIKPEKVQQGLLDFITASSLNVNIEVFENVHIASDEKFKIYTHQLRVEGDYKNLVLLLASLEREFDLSKIASASFEVSENYGGKKKELFLNILFQNYEKI